MVTDSKDPPPNFPPRALIVGNFCHDFLIRDAHVVTESLGGAASFISTVFDGLSVPYLTVSKVGDDFAYSTKQSPIVVPNSKTTTFRAFFDSSIAGDGHGDRILKRVVACAPILPSDLPDFRFDFGMAVGVGGEVLPETLERMIEICDAVFVDVQSLIRVFDEIDGTVEHVNLKESGFFHLLPRIGFLKASAEEAPFMDVEEVRKLCPVVVTNGKEGCTLYSNGSQLQIAPFMANQLDPTGAGDSFLGGFAAGFTAGLAVPDAALLGNLFGSLTVSQIGLPHFESRILQVSSKWLKNDPLKILISFLFLSLVNACIAICFLNEIWKSFNSSSREKSASLRIKDEVERRKLLLMDSCDPGENKSSIHRMPEGHKQFQKLLGTVRSECRSNLPASSIAMEQVNGQHKLL